MSKARASSLSSLSCRDTYASGECVFGGVMGRRKKGEYPGMHPSSQSTQIRFFIFYFFCCTRDFKDSCTSCSEGGVCVCVWCTEKKTVLDRQNFVWKKWSILDFFLLFFFLLFFPNGTAVRPNFPTSPPPTPNPDPIIHHIQAVWSIVRQKVARLVSWYSVLSWALLECSQCGPKWGS